MQTIAVPVQFPDAEASIVQIHLSPTYMEVMLGHPPDSWIMNRLPILAERLWGKGAEYHTVLGPQRKVERPPGFSPGTRRMPLTVLVELESPQLLPGADYWDVGSWAHLVYLTEFDGLEEGLSKFVQRFVDASELRWENIARNYSP